ncbi:MAG: hypothetical protein MUC80_05610 [Candidatus Thermoplasmatota archaeon]|jgi:hypothetical protein|nr:hypothetical protein [Candidatus Thermoplasmatota archaeon]
MKKVILAIGATLLLCTIALSGCNEQKKPVISNFEARPNEIELGQIAYLQWTVSDATSVTINNGIGVVPLSGNRSIIPTMTTTYTLTAIGSSTVTATTTVTVTEPTEKPNITLAQTEFFIEIIGAKNNHILQSEVQIIAINTNSTIDETTALGPNINDGDGNQIYIGVGDAITFENLSVFPVGELWDIQVSYNGEIIGECSFKNPKGPYDKPNVRMIQSNTSIVILRIINGPLEQGMCSITAENMTSNAIQTTLLGVIISDNDGDPTTLGISDQIIFSSLSQFKAGDGWLIRLVYNGETIGQCSFINPGGIIIIP